MSAKLYGKLASGKEIAVDVDMLRQDIKTRRDHKRIVGGLSAVKDEYDQFLAKYSGMTMEEVELLSPPDWKALDDLVSLGLRALFSPNGS